MSNEVDRLRGVLLEEKREHLRTLDDMQRVRDVALALLEQLEEEHATAQDDYDTPRCRVVAEYAGKVRRVMGATAPGADTPPDPVAAVLALADALDAEAVDPAAGVSIDRRAGKVHAAARIRRALGVPDGDC